MIQAVSQLVTDFPEITEVDLNPVLAREDGATAVDARFVVSFEESDAEPPRYSQEEILETMKALMQPRAIAVVGASGSEGKIGNSVMKNLVNGGLRGRDLPDQPEVGRDPRQEGLRRRRRPAGRRRRGGVLHPRQVRAGHARQGRREGDQGRRADPLGLRRDRRGGAAAASSSETAREHGVRFIGPNIYGVYYTPGNMSAAFTTPYDVKGPVALASQSGGIGMGILGFARSTKLGVSAIVGLGNKADIDEDDLLTFFEQDDATNCVALHMEDLKDGRAFVEVAQRVSKKKPIVVLKAGATPAGTKAAASHTAALAGDDKVYEDILREAGVVRARGLQELLQFARCLPILPTPDGRERRDHHGRRRLGSAAVGRRASTTASS